MTVGEEIFLQNARAILRDIGMPHLDWAHGAAVNIVRRSMNVRDRPTHHQQAFLEAEAPALLAYLETLAESGEIAAWRTLHARVRLHAEVLQESGMHPCARPRVAAIWHALPELAALGQLIIDRVAKKEGHAPYAEPVFFDVTTETSGDGEKGSAGKAGSATSHRPRPSPRLAFPTVTVTPTPAEEKALDLEDQKSDDDISSPVGPETQNGVTGPRPDGGLK
ncbi:hypothetical protein [Peteryoungia algae]|uniref:Uncharacterized protein n=1 Tax=Peteryoungia algae TaxID=2919917 RepID=A0ABT0CW69_9HYPH|nr:hypothetical protein [Rhizobium sp. SSM4.3]MCJ8237402.1 hypothetical protein [Rhizobium sp. SSM4.3]